MTTRANDLGAYRNDGPDTMHEGAREIADKLPTLRARVLELFREHLILTDNDLLALYAGRWGGGEYRSLSTRRRELVDRGFIVDSGVRRRNPVTGVNNIIWKLVVLESTP